MSGRALAHLLEDYPRFHQDRVNLAIHILAVPLFVVGSVGSLWSLMAGHWLRAGALILVPAVSLAAQGIGHKREVNPPLPFHGPADFLLRIFLEQFLRFPAFVLTGKWMAARNRGGH